MGVYFFYDDSESVPFMYLTPCRMAGQLPPPYQTDMSPEAYLEYAIADSKDGSQRSRVNALGNIKRALHLGIDSLLNQYGLFVHLRRSNFPEKLRALDSIGLLPIKVMENLNLERNLVEHEYTVPPAKRMEEAIDVTKLLLLATEKLVEATPYEVVVGWRHPRRHTVLRLDPLKGCITLHLLGAPSQYSKMHGINCFRGPLRALNGSDLMPGVRVSKKPWKTILLNPTQASEWKPILRELVNVQRRQRSRKTYVDKDSALVTIPVTIPLPALAEGRWTDILDRFLQRKPLEKIASGSDSEPESAPQTAGPPTSI